MNKYIFKNIGAIILGFLTIVGFSLSVDKGLEVIGFLPKDPTLYTTKILLISVVYRSVFSILGGFVVGKLASQKQMKSVIILAIIGTLIGITGVITGWNMPGYPHWYAITLATLTFPCIWFGGKLQTYTWIKVYEVVTREATKEQMWKLFTNVNSWHVWNKEIKFAKIEGAFEAGNHYTIQPQKGPLVKVTLLDVVTQSRCLELGKFPLAKMYYDHTLEETTNGLRVTNTITVKGVLGFLWVLLIVRHIAAKMPEHVQQQIQIASRL